jgi:hypothetical protein
VAAAASVRARILGAVSSRRPSFIRHLAAHAPPSTTAPDATATNSIDASNDTSTKSYIDESYAVHTITPQSSEGIDGTYSADTGINAGADHTSDIEPSAIVPTGDTSFYPHDSSHLPGPYLHDDEHSSGEDAGAGMEPWDDNASMSSYDEGETQHTGEDSEAEGFEHVLANDM